MAKKILSKEDIAAKTGLDKSWVEKLIKTGYMKPKEMAADREVLAGGPDEKKRAEEAKKDGKPFIAKTRIMPAEETLAKHMALPRGKRYYDPQVKREVGNLVDGRPVEEVRPVLVTVPKDIEYKGEESLSQKTARLRKEKAEKEKK